MSLKTVVQSAVEARIALNPCDVLISGKTWTGSKTKLDVENEYADIGFLEAYETSLILLLGSLADDDTPLAITHVPNETLLTVDGDTYRVLDHTIGSTKTKLTLHLGAAYQ